jgi:hypothetical protein
MRSKEQLSGFLIAVDGLCDQISHGWIGSASDPNFPSCPTSF